MPEMLSPCLSNRNTIRVAESYVRSCDRFWADRGRPYGCVLALLVITARVWSLLRYGSCGGRPCRDSPWFTSHFILGGKTIDPYHYWPDFTLIAHVVDIEDKEVIRPYELEDLQIEHAAQRSRSEVGKGTTFRVYLPAIEGEMEMDTETRGIMPAFGTETILLVDDEEFVREPGARILTRHGYTVLQAENGREALDLFQEKRPQISLVILDLIMPEMGGAECLKELLKIDPKVKILVASGYSADASLKETIQMGAKGFVTKPFRVKELLGDVRRVFDES